MQFIFNPEFEQSIAAALVEGCSYAGIHNIPIRLNLNRPGIELHNADC